jgi:hypothetical protein
VKIKQMFSLTVLLSNLPGTVPKVKPAAVKHATTSPAQPIKNIYSVIIIYCFKMA